MKKSIWLENYEKEVREKRNKSGQNKKIILIVIPVILLMFLVAAIVGMASSGTIDSQMMGGLLAMLGVFAFVMLFAMMMIKKGKKVDAAKGTRENVLALFKTDEDVDSFDRQMSGVPMMELQIGTETTVFLTEEYVGMRFLYLGDLQYCFACRAEIVALDYSKTSGAGANPMKASWFFDVKDAQNQKVLGGVVETGEKLEQMMAMLKEVQPNLVVTKR